jgi:YD repeat-containing protein
MPNLLTDANGNKTFISSYQCSGLFPQTVIQAYQSTSTLAETTTSTKDCNTGTTTSSTDPNGVVSNYIYSDPLGRLTQVQSAVGSPGVETHTTVTYPSLMQANVAQDQATVGDGVLQTSSVYDGLGRVIQQKNAAGYVVCTTYNAMGQVATVSNPVSSCPASSGNLISYYYDPLGRPVKEVEQDCSTKWWCYDGVVDAYNAQPNCSGKAISNANGVSWVDTTDEAGVHYQQVSDTLGELIAVVEPDPVNGGLALETDYTYDTLGNLRNLCTGVVIS